jgi:hypothetical protein
LCADANANVDADTTACADLAAVLILQLVLMM